VRPRPRHANRGHGDLQFAFIDARTGAPIDDLQPYLAAAGHVVVMRGDALTFAHEHAEVNDDRSRPVFALPGQTFGPQLGVHADFPTSGRYHIWGQFRLATAGSSPHRSPSPPPERSCWVQTFGGSCTEAEVARISVKLDADLVIDVMLLAGVRDAQDAVEVVLRDYVAHGRRTDAISGAAAEQLRRAADERRPEG
jgi:Arc/MetJ family transcription regulator